MRETLFNWRFLLLLLAISLVVSTVWYSRILAKKIALEERRSVEAWVEAERTIMYSTDSASINLAVKITTENTKIPIIETNEQNIPTGNTLNLDTNYIQQDSTYLTKKLIQFKQYNNEPIVLVLNQQPYTANKYYYGPSKLLQEVTIYPFVQLAIAVLVIIIAWYNVRVRYRSNQNQLWAGMAKETAHQLGTPVSSLQGWVELLKEKEPKSEIALEIEKDTERLRLISERFGKIGSTPQLEMLSITQSVKGMMDYMKKRSGNEVNFQLTAIADFIAPINPPLFEWVIENLIKNALNAMHGKGTIECSISKYPQSVSIDMRDTGKGIPRKDWEKIFTPGFTTRKRGWGVGLTLCKRIIEHYHKGKIFVVKSEINKGSTFRIILPC